VADTPGPSAGTSGLDGQTNLTGSQRTLLQVFVDKDESLGRMYVGALMARSATDNPDYLSQASHSLRELVDKLPEHFEGVPAKPVDKLGNKVNTLIAYWKKEQRVKNKSDESLSDGFMKRLDEFFTWQLTNHLTRREAARRTIRKFDATGRALPDRIEELHAEEWMAIRGFFVGITHHETCTADEFDTWLTAFETFMLNRTKPRTFEKADEIDRLIAEGESNG
jgi:hypothetical protein